MLSKSFRCASLNVQGRGASSITFADLLPLPAAPYDASDKHATRVSSQSLVRYRSNDYSVPVASDTGMCW